MTSKEHNSPRPLRLRLYAVVLAVIWTVIVAASLGWNMYYLRHESLRMAYSEARASWDTEDLFRRWIVGHGGVYVLATGKTPPNLHLSHLEDRDAETSSGKPLTLMNGAYVMRQLHELTQTGGNYQGHLASLRPIWQGNIADPWEKNALQAFERGESEVSGVAMVDDKPHMRFMRPLVTQQSCLKCHAEHGYAVGDIRCGISVSVPMGPHWVHESTHVLPLTLGHGSIWILGLMGISMAARILGKRSAELEQSKAVLQESERYYRTLIFSLHEDILVIDRDYRITDINNTALHTLGLKREEVIGRHCYAVSHGQNSPCHEHGKDCGLHRVLDTGESCNLHHSHINADGEIVHVDMLMSPMKDKDGNITHVIEAARDVTDLFQIRESLQKSEEKYGTYVENAPVGIFIADSSGRYIDVNPAACLMTGYSREELLSMSIPELASPESLPETLETFNDLKETGKIQIEIVLRKKDGTDFHSSLRAVALSDNRFMAFCSDITERKRAEEALRLQGEITANMSEGVYLIGVDDLKIKYTNAKLAEIFGYGPDEMVGKDVSIVNAPTEMTPKETVDHIVGILRETGIWRGEIQNIKKDGTPFWCYANASLFDHRDHGKIIISVHTDITEHRKMEKELQKMEKLESIGILAGGIAHDLNNFLTAIVGNISLAMMYEDPQEKDRRLVEADKACMQIKDLTQQLLTFSKGGAPILRTAAIGGLLRDLAIFTLRGSNVGCEFSISDDLWPAEVDEGQINQVINNLIINSQQAMPDGGTVTIRAENITMGTAYDLPLEPGAYIKVSVEDQGIGIPQEHLQRIFDPFFTTKQAGSGLGLATSYSIIERHKGHMTVESQIGVGTTFHIYLPASPEGVLMEVEEEKKPIMGEGRILVMDDEKHVRDTVAAVLSSIGYEAITAIDGVEAIEIYKEAMASDSPFDAIIIDLTIPGGMGGRETIQRLMEIDSEIKAIVSSGYSNDPILVNFREHGFMGFIPKPYKIQELSEILHRVITGTD